MERNLSNKKPKKYCLLYTSDAADEQRGMGLAKKYDPSLFDEENDDGQTGRICCLWDDEDFED